MKGGQDDSIFECVPAFLGSLLGPKHCQHATQYHVELILKYQLDRRPGDPIRGHLFNVQKSACLKMPRAIATLLAVPNVFISSFVYGPRLQLLLP